ncbi:MAG: DsbE family thiol:disulfide interchange protein [Hyphomicrobiales bacterium]|nr:DsbE family thiol:disulfide interchange protein [Hyphomicrobiales bacterium]
MSDDTDTSPKEMDARQPSRGRRRIVAYLPLILFGALALLFLFRLDDAGNNRKLPSALIDRPVPEFDLPPLDGLTRDGVPLPGLATADLKPGDGAPTIVNVWASWCVPCRQEHPVLMEIARAGKYRLVGINYKDRPGNARRFLNDLGNPFSAVGTDQSGRVGIDWGVYGVPETYIVDGDGVIRFKYVGPLSEEVMAKTFQPALDKVAGGGASN